MSEAVKSASEQKKEDWMNSKWRPMMGWMYMVVCTMDMVIFPILWSLLQTATGTQITQWNPLTLQGAGLFHIAMGAVLGIAAFGRTQEKLGGANNGGLNTATNSSPSFSPAPTAPAAGGFGSSATTGAGSFGSPVPSTGFGGSSFGSSSKPVTAVSSSGKPMPAQPEQPEI
jgi:hypothetical protein